MCCYSVFCTFHHLFPASRFPLLLVCSLRADLLLGPLMLFQVLEEAIRKNRAEAIYDVLTTVYNMIIALPGSKNYKRVIASFLRLYMHHLPAVLADHALKAICIQSRYA